MGSNIWPNSPVITRLKDADLMSSNSKSWSPDLILLLVGRVAANKVFHTLLFEVVHMDRLIWMFEGNGNYSVRSAYRYCINEVIDTSHLTADGN